jgi:ketosteroid isomerase-like protein
MKRSVFSLFAVLLFSALAWWASVGIREVAAMDKSMNAPVPSNDPAAIEAIRQIGRDMGDAMVAVDIDKLNQIFADDWAAVGTISGKVITKEKVLENFKSGKDKLVSYELGPIDVQVFGDVAVAHGGVTEKRIRDGKDVSGDSVYMDLLEKRAGKWVVVRIETKSALSWSLEPLSAAIFFVAVSPFSLGSSLHQLALRRREDIANGSPT